MPTNRGLFNGFLVKSNFKLILKIILKKMIGCVSVVFQNKLSFEAHEISLDEPVETSKKECTSNNRERGVFASLDLKWEDERAVEVVSHEHSQ